MISKAVGIQPAEKGGVTLTTKKHKHLNRPAANKNEVSWGGNKSGPKSVLRRHTTCAGYFANDFAIGSTKASSITQQSKAIGQTYAKRLSLVQALSANRRDQRRKTQSQSCEAPRQRRRRRRRHDWRSKLGF